MNGRIRRGITAAPLLALVAAVVLFVVVVLIDVVGIERSVFADEVPSWGAIYWLRTALLAASAFALVSALMAWNGDKRQLSGVQLSEVPRSAVLAIPAGALACVSLLAIGPRYFTRLALEDRPVEYLSVLLLLGSAALVVAAVRIVARQSSKREPLLLLPLALAGVFFLIAMEEISWFQRILSVETPEALESNAQGELNLHNFATTPTENAYYFGAFIALMVVPLAMQASGIRLPGPLHRFRPGAITALASAPAFAFNFDMWNNALMQFSFYGAVFLVLWWVARELDEADRWLAYYVAGATVVVQIVMVTLGDRSDLIWDATEYKEMFIPAGFAVYSYVVFERVRAARSAATRAPVSAVAQNG